ncbi:4'-phosphopantetheinyl transferase [Rhizobium sp. L1K21]|uniref:4'-phosphopantetheinyl transferase family protein n=1 Tax=Rhizobium sp. L1K21 TaxID=2954933 RepID=UPI002093A981|nr:4'-phosphopantetheinyl transferase superfamily protein [Rhizobium sp. L1K21]MCO6187574.1 4'-phosphopantetheinyl transferase superfamily protein [Rhizobium sp. L1K21]
MRARRRAEFVAGRLCAIQSLKSLNSPATAPAEGPDRAPVWPDNIIGSITHSGHWALSIAAGRQHYSGIGVDLEEQLSAQSAAEIRAQVFSEWERQRFGIDVDASLTGLAFSAKESLFKALYPITRQHFGFHAAHIVDKPRNGFMQLRLDVDLDPQFRKGRQFDVQYDYFGDRLLTWILVGKTRTNTSHTNDR